MSQASPRDWFGSCKDNSFAPRGRLWDVQAVSRHAGGIGGVVQGEGGLQLHHPCGWCGGTKTAPRLFPEGTSDRNAAAVTSGSRTLKGTQGEEEGPVQHKKHRPLAVPSEAPVGCSLALVWGHRAAVGELGSAGAVSQGQEELCPRACGFTESIETLTGVRGFT